MKQCQNIADAKGQNVSSFPCPLNQAVKSNLS
jgi:hypothetical protein